MLCFVFSLILRNEQLQWPFVANPHEKSSCVFYLVMINLMLLMLTLPLKMILRWTLNLRYLISIPEFSLNF